MDHFKLVLPEHNNHYGHLFGGHLLNWIDEFAYITAAVDFPGRRFVTVAMDDVEFRHRIYTGEVLRFSVEQTTKGTTSVTYAVSVFSTGTSSAVTHSGGEPAVVIGRDMDTVLFSTSMTFVNVDQNGDKAAI